MSAGREAAVHSGIVRHDSCVCQSSDDILLSAFLKQKSWGAHVGSRNCCSREVGVVTRTYCGSGKQVAFLMLSGLISEKG